MISPVLVSVKQIELPLLKLLYCEVCYWQVDQYLGAWKLNRLMMLD